MPIIVVACKRVIKQRNLRTLAHPLLQFSENYMAHACVDGLLALLTDSSESEKLKTCLLEAFAWFTHSYRKPDILRVCDQLRKDKSLSENLREEADRTYYRLKINWP